jgi:phage terminase large subunit-like protein
VEFSPGYRGFLKFAETVGLGLEPFHRQIARAFFAGERTLLVLLPKGNGKSTLVAALALHHLLTHREPAIYIGAASVAQARIIFEVARDMSRKLPAADQVVIRALELRREDGGGVLRMLPSDGPRTHGITPTLAILDELWAHRDGALFESMTAALVKRPDAKLVVISTADVGEERPLCRLRARALAQPSVERSGPLVECRGPTLRALLWEVADEVGVDDLDEIAAVNPASWISREALVEQRENLPEGAFLRFHANQRVAPQGAWLPAGAWQRVVGDPDFQPGERIWAALDVGGTESATALVWVSESLQVGCWIDYGDEAIFGAANRLRELREEFTVVEFSADPWRAKQLLLEMEREGLTIAELPQTDMRMCPASVRLRSAIVEERITLPDDPELARHAANAVQRHVRRGWRLEKADRRSPIDAMIALAMCVERAEQQPEPLRLLGWA